jgi:hypothetical protein
MELVGELGIDLIGRGRANTFGAGRWIREVMRMVGLVILVRFCDLQDFAKLAVGGL